MAQGVAIEFQVRAGLGFTVIESDYIEARPSQTRMLSIRKSISVPSTIQ